MNNLNNRVVVTGMGVVCPLGLNISTTWEALIAGKSGIDYITLFDPEPLETKIAGEVKGFEPTDYINRKEARRMDRFAQLAVAASLQAVEQAGLQINSMNQDNIAIIVGSGIGGLTTLFEQTKIMLEKGPNKVSPFLVPMMISDMAAAQVSITLGVKGPNLCTTSACSSGSDAIGVGYGLLILENLAHAQKRGANILAEVIAYGASADAYHITQPDENGEGAARAMQVALDKAGITAAEIDYINAHGTSTPLNDKTETISIKSVFGDNAYKIPISSTKSMMGHLIGGAGAVEAAICIMVIQHGIIPPTINLTHPNPECDLDYVSNVARRAKVTTALSNSFGFGGHNSVLVFRQYTEALA